MGQRGGSAELSIIVPALNEACHLDTLLACLQGQEGISFELILSDGGSVDGTPERAESIAGGVDFPVRVLRCAPGRGRQMNCGARAAKGRWLLFLHADSFFPATDALARGVAHLCEQSRCAKGTPLAGHFALRFRRRSGSPSLAYAFYETKAHLNRSGCIHGDQGFLLSSGFFREVGPFDESLPYLEDERLAARVAARGRWELLPAVIETSARRFETEGLRPRQTLNALIMNFEAIGWEEFLASAPALYRRQDRAGRLDLLPFFEQVAALLKTYPFRRRWRLWYQTGGYVRSQGWQVVLWWILRRRFLDRESLREKDLEGVWKAERFFDSLTDHRLGRGVTAGLVWGWFQLIRLSLRVKRPSRKIQGA